MIFAAGMGGLLALSREKTDSRWDAVQFIGVAIGLSLALTGAGVWAIEKFTELPGSLAIMPVAFGFAAARSLIIKFIGDMLDAIVGRFSKSTGGAQ
jgi:hypothetical protein